MVEYNIMGQESLTISVITALTTFSCCKVCLKVCVIVMFALETGVEDQLIDIRYLLCTYQGECARMTYISAHFSF